MNKCKISSDTYGPREFDKIKRVAMIEREGSVYCFSCPEVNSFINFKAEIKVGDGTLLKFSDSEIEYFKDFLEKNNCEEDSDDEEVEILKVTSPNDTIPYLEKLGILEEVLKKEFTQEEFDDFLRKTRTVTIPVGLNIHVRDYFKDFLLTKISENRYLQHYENNNIPMLETKYGNINDNVIEYYKNIDSFLKELGVKDEFVNYVKTFIYTKLTLFINGVRKTIPIEYENDGTRLRIFNKQITSIEGAVFLPSLTELDISHNNLTSLVGIPSTLTKLEIVSNKITSLVSPQGETLLPSKLTELKISENNIVSLEGLPPNLNELNISHNQIKSLEGLPNSLTKLNISFNYGITSLVSPQGEALLPPRLTNLDISKNKIKSLKGLPETLKHLNISYNQVNSLEGLPSSLIGLWIIENNLNSLVSPSGKSLLPSNLTKLDISRNNFTSLEGLPRNLTYLKISHNNFTSLVSPFGEALLPPNLTYLNISHNKIKVLQGIPQKITELLIDDNPLESIEGLPPNLEQLYISKSKKKKFKNILDNYQNNKYFSITTI